MRLASARRGATVRGATVAGGVTRSFTTSLLLALHLSATAAPAVEQELATPRQALRFFVESCRDGDFGRAAQALDLRAIREADRPTEGPSLARQLKFVLSHKLWIDWDKVSDASLGSPEGRGVEVVGGIPLGAGEVPVRLVRSADGAWRIGSSVVAAIPRLYEAYGPGWLGARMPPVLEEVSFLDVSAWQWLGLALDLALAALVAFVAGSLGRRVVLRLVRRTPAKWDDALVNAARGPGRSLLAVATLAVTVRTLRLALPVQEVVDRVLQTTAVVLLTWVALRGLRLFADLLGARISLGGNAEAARSRLTQIMVLKRVTDFVVLLIGGAFVLRQFDAMRVLGTSLLASASVAGIVVGLAAQRSIGMLLAGVQISLTQPLRVGDVVVIEGEWGTIEEITLTYVVVRIWDLRRLVVPITRILDAPFQNWTRAGSELLGTVLLYADYRLPVDEVRRELERFVSGRPEWDGKTAALQVTGATDRTIELRAVVSAPDSSRGWDLRCAVREHLLEFIQQLEGGAFLPRVRIEPPAVAAEASATTARAGEPPPPTAIRAEG